jgi:hypothetical protein
MTPAALYRAERRKWEAAMVEAARNDTPETRHRGRERDVVDMFKRSPMGKQLEDAEEIAYQMRGQSNESGMKMRARAGVYSPEDTLIALADSRPW